jgi:hypothetical protein
LDNVFLSASVGCLACGLFVSAATTSGDPAELWCSALFSAAAQALLIAMAQAKPMQKMAIVRFMIAPYNEVVYNIASLQNTQPVAKSD